MLRRDWLLIAALALCLATAVGCGFYLLGGGSSPLTIIAVAIFFLVGGQLVLLAMAGRQASELTQSHRNLVTDLVTLSRYGDDGKRQSEFMLAQISELRQCGRCIGFC
jgi:hypothetical protein